MVGVPPEAWDVRVIDWPLSIVGLDGVMALATRGGLTVTVSPEEHGRFAGVPCEASANLYV